VFRGAQFFLTSSPSSSSGVSRRAVLPDVIALFFLWYFAARSSS
jgi:hypothetical protein